MEVVYARVAAIDVGKREIAVTVRVPGQRRDTRTQQTRKFRTFYQVLRQMVGWLLEREVHPRGDGGDRGVLEAGLPRPV